MREERVSPVTAFAITDVLVHDPSSDPASISIQRMVGWKSFLVKVISSLDQGALVTIFGNDSKSTTNAVAFAAIIGVPAGTTVSRVYSQEIDGWMPFIYPSIQALIAPASGTVTVTFIKLDRMRDS